MDFGKESDNSQSERSINTDWSRDSVVIPGDQAHSWAGLPVTMPRKTETGSKSSASLTKPTVPQQLMVPCSVKLDSFQQSSKKLVLKDGSGYYILRRESLRYKIEGIKVLRSRNRSMPTATKDRESKMNRRDPRGDGFHHYPQSRDYQGDYHSRYDGRYSGPDRSRGRGHRHDQRYWPPRGGRGHRNSYGRDHSDGQYGNRRSWSRDDSYGERRVKSPEGRFYGERDGSFDDRPGRYPDQRPERRKHHSDGSISQEAPKSLASTYKKNNVSSMENNHVASKDAPEEEGQSEKVPKEKIVNNERTKRNHICDIDKSSSLTTENISNSDTIKAAQGTTVEATKPSSQKPPKKGVLTMSQQIESLKNKDKTEVKETSTSKSNNAIISRTGNGESAKGSPHRTEVSVQNHSGAEKPSKKGSGTVPAGKSETVAASPSRVHTARKSAPSSSISKTQKSDMLKKQALLRSQSNQDVSASTGRSSPTARIGSGEVKPPQLDADNGSTPPKSEKVSSDLQESASKKGDSCTLLPKEDSGTSSDMEECKMETSSKDEGIPGEGTGKTTTLPVSVDDAGTPSEPTSILSDFESKEDKKLSKEQSVPAVTSEECLPQKIIETEKDDVDEAKAAAGSSATCETECAVTSGEPEKSGESEKSPDVGKIKERALLKLKENLKKNLMKGKISPENSTPSSRCGSRSNSISFPASPVDPDEVTANSDQSKDNKMGVAEDSGANLKLSQHSNPDDPTSTGKPNSVSLVNGKEVCNESIEEPSIEGQLDEKAANRVDVDMANDKQTSQSEDLKCNAGETQASQGSKDPLPDEGDHICNNVAEDCTKISSASEKPDTIDSPVNVDMLEVTDELTEQSLEESQKVAVSFQKVDSSGRNVDELSDGSVDLGPTEPGDMDALDDDLLLEDEATAFSEGYNPEPEKMDDSEFSGTVDSELSEIAIAKVESQSEDVLQKLDSEQPSTSKRGLILEGEEADGEPASKKSRTETEDIIEGVDIPEKEELAGLDDSQKPVIFTHNEWKEFAQSIKEKYEKLVQTFNQKTNVMYEAQACWQQETISWKKKYEELERKYEHLAVQVKENPTIEKQSVEVQTNFTHRTKLSRKKKSLDKSPQEEPMEIDQGSSKPVDATTSSGPSQTTSDSSSALDASASNKPNNLESKRQVFKATLNKVMQSKKNLSGTSEGGNASTSPRATTPRSSVTPEPSSSPKPSSSPDPSKEEPKLSQGATISAQEASGSTATEDSSKDSPMDTSSTEPKSQSDTTPESKSTKGPNEAASASGTLTAASQTQATSTSTPSPEMHTSKLPSQSDTTSAPAIPSPSPSHTSTPSPSSPPKAQSETSEKTKVPSATDSSTLPGSPKHSTSAKAPEASKDSSRKSGSDAEKDSQVSKTDKPAQVQAEPEVIDLTDDPDPPAVSVSKPTAPIPHKAVDAPPVGKHSTLTTRSPHKLVSTPGVPSPTAGAARVTSASAASCIKAPPTASVTVAARQGQISTQNQQNPVQRPGPRTFVVTTPRTSSTTGPVASPKRTSPCTPQNPSPNKTSSSPGNTQLKNVNPPVMTTLLPGTNVRSQVVTLQHGQNRPQITAPLNQVTVSPVSAQQRQQATTIAGVQPAQMATSIQNQARVPGQVAIQQRIQQTQQQQQINLQMLQQGRQGVHQLPGAAAAALATRQPQPWLQQTRPQLQITSSQQQSLQVCQQIQLPTGQVQVQMVRPVGTAQTFTTSALQAGPQQALQKQQQQQQQQQQIQAQERAHAASMAQAAAKAAREKREQEQHQQARAAAQRLQSSQVDQQQAQMAKIKNLQSERHNAQTKAQQHQNKKRQLLNQIQRVEEYQRNLKNQLQGSSRAGMNLQVYQNCQKQLKEVQDQERHLRAELVIIESSLVECQINTSKIEQQIRAATTVTSRLSPQEMQKHQLQQQQQQLSQQLAQRQLQQQRNQQLQQQQQQLQQQQAAVQEQKHPAPLPDLTATIDKSRGILFTPMPIKPVLEIKHSQEGIVLSWKADPTAGAAKVEVKRYLLYAYQESESATPSTDLWKKIGAVDALPLPMACTLTHFKAGSMYHFAVCAISKHGRPGAFSNVGNINLP